MEKENESSKFQFQRPVKFDISVPKYFWCEHWEIHKQPSYTVLIGGRTTKACSGKGILETGGVGS